MGSSDPQEVTPLDNHADDIEVQEYDCTPNLRGAVEAKAEVAEALDVVNYAYEIDRDSRAFVVELLDGRGASRGTMTVVNDGATAVNWGLPVGDDATVAATSEDVTVNSFGPHEVELTTDDETVRLTTTGWARHRDGDLAVAVQPGLAKVFPQLETRRAQIEGRGQTLTLEVDSTAGSGHQAVAIRYMVRAETVEPRAVGW